MPTVKLTEKSAQAATAPEGSRLELWDEQTPGLCLRVSASGRKVWIWRYRTADGRQPRLTLGDFSDRYGVRWVRDQVDELRMKVRRGEDPQYEPKAAAIAARTEPLKTFEDLAAVYFLACEKGRWKPRRKQKRQSTIENERAILKRNVMPVIGALRLEDIGKAEIRRLLDGMLDRGIGAQTNKTHAVIRQVLAFAVSEERIPTNAAALISQPAEVTARKRTLSDAELKVLWAALNADDELWIGEGDARRRLYIGPAIGSPPRSFRTSSGPDRPRRRTFIQELRAVRRTAVHAHLGCISPPFSLSLHQR